MMVTLTWFESEQDLQELTGLDHDGLWDAGFDLDDWDFGFVTDFLLDIKEYMDMNFNCGHYYLLKFLIWDAYKWDIRKYNGKYYYMSYHA